MNWQIRDPMSFKQCDNLKFYLFDLLQSPKIIHGVFTRWGGVSPAPWSSLNIGGMNGDVNENVIENKRRLFSVMGLPIESIFDVWQVHSDKVIRIDGPRPSHEEHLEADGMITDKPGITLLMRFGDCVPVLLFDPIRDVIGLVHAGWLGTVKKICKNAVSKMHDFYDSDPGDILAGIGPSIGPDCYTIGSEVVNQVETTFGPDSSKLLRQHNGRITFDLWKANQVLLSQAGVQKIQIARLCTACNVHDWFSHRAEQGETGRFGAVIALKTNN